MAVLDPSEYDESYFDGASSTYQHNAGYSKYKRWRRWDLGSDENKRESEDEFFKDIANEMFKKNFDYTGKKVLDIGCAYGFIVEDLRNMGVDAWGIDVSQYAYDKASDEVKPYLTVADARTHLTTYSKNEFDAVFSRYFLECISDEDLPDLIEEMNRISKFQLHIVMKHGKEEYYNIKDAAGWQVFDWDKGSYLMFDWQKFSEAIVL